MKKKKIFMSGTKEEYLKIFISRSDDILNL